MSGPKKRAFLPVFAYFSSREIVCPDPKKGWEKGCKHLGAFLCVFCSLFSIFGKWSCNFCAFFNALSECDLNAFFCFSMRFKFAYWKTGQKLHGKAGKIDAPFLTMRNFSRIFSRPLPPFWRGAKPELLAKLRKNPVLFINTLIFGVMPEMHPSGGAKNPKFPHEKKNF